MFEYISETTDIGIVTQQFPNAGIGEQFQLKSRDQETTGLTTTEITLLDQVIHDLGQWDTDQRITKSHQENAWQANADNKSQWINYLK